MASASDSDLDRELARACQRRSDLRPIFDGDDGQGFRGGGFVKPEVGYAAAEDGGERGVCWDVGDFRGLIRRVQSLSYDTSEESGRINHGL